MSKESANISIELLRDAVPKSKKALVTEELVQTINEFKDDEDSVKAYRDNLVGFASVINEGKWSLEEYTDAVRFVSYRLVSNSDIDSYMRAFPDRYAKLIADGRTREEMGAWVAAYKKNKLVIKILEQTMVPTHILNADIYQEAINTQLDLMKTSKRDDVRQKAADSLMNHLAQPVETKLNIKVGMDDKILENQNRLIDHIGSMALNQQKQLASGMSIEDIQKLNIQKTKEDIVDAELEEYDA
jgi:hypothetical protein